jgi:predicted nucleic acid-binding protein
VTYLLDTNIVSVLVQPSPDPRVVNWIRATSPLDLGISVLVLGEVEQGVASLPPGRRRDELQAWARDGLPRLFAGRILPVTPPIAREWGRLRAEARHAGRPLPVVDGLLLATASAHRLTLATRNVADLAQRGVPVFDPYTGTLHQ